MSLGNGTTRHPIRRPFSKTEKERKCCTCPPPPCPFWQQSWAHKRPSCQNTVHKGSACAQQIVAFGTGIPTLAPVLPPPPPPRSPPSATLNPSLRGCFCTAPNSKLGSHDHPENHTTSRSRAGGELGMGMAKEIESILECRFTTFTASC